MNIEEKCCQSWEISKGDFVSKGLKPIEQAITEFEERFGDEKFIVRSKFQQFLDELNRGSRFLEIIRVTESSDPVAYFFKESLRDSSEDERQ